MTMMISTCRGPHFHVSRDFETPDVMISGGQTHDLNVIRTETHEIGGTPDPRILGFTYGFDMSCQDPRCQTLVSWFWP